MGRMSNMALENRYDFIMLFDVENGNPNGDPDAGNTPRVDVESGYGFITDVCLKRKIRNYVELVKEGEAGYNILVKPDRSLNAKFTAAYEAEGLPKKNKGKNADDVKSVAADLKENVMGRQWMCGFPDKLVVISVDDYLVSVFGNEELVNTFKDKLTQTYENAKVISEDGIV